MATSFKVEILKGVHNFTSSTGDVFKIALFKGSAEGSGTYGATTTNYSEMGENELPTATGYTRGGAIIAAVTPVSDGTTAIVTFADATWASAAFTTSGALIYNSTQDGRAVAVLSFSGDQTVSSGDFVAQMPAATAAAAVVRVT